MAEVHAELGLALHRQGDLSAAVASFREALEMKPGLTGVYSLLGYDLLMLGQAAEALPYLEQAVEATPRDGKLKSWLGLAYLRAGDSRRAVETLTAVRAGQPGRYRRSALPDRSAPSSSQGSSGVSHRDHRGSASSSR